MPGPRDAAEEAIILLIYSLDTPGNSVISTAFFISLMDARWIVVRQSSFSSLSTLNPWSQHDALLWEKHTSHNGHPQQKGGHSGSGTRNEDKEALRQREKRKKPREAPGEIATKVAGQAKQLFCSVIGLLQEFELWCTFSLDDL